MLVTCSVLEEDAEPQLRADSTADGFPGTAMTPASSGDFGKMMHVINFRAHRKRHSASLLLFNFSVCAVIGSCVFYGWWIVLLML